MIHSGPASGIGVWSSAMARSCADFAPHSPPPPRGRDLYPLDLEPSSMRSDRKNGRPIDGLVRYVLGTSSEVTHMHSSVLLARVA